MAFFRRNTNLSRTGDKTIPDGLWMKCSACNQTVYRSDVEQNLERCPQCSHHYRVGARRRVDLHFDPGSFLETHVALRATDPLGFQVGEESYINRVARAQEQAGINEALLTGFARLEGLRVALGVMDSRFIMASMGSALGEKFCRLVDDAITERTPMIVFAASGGARMQEGILSLMQMAKAVSAQERHRAKGLPFLSVLLHPTTGGVAASFAFLGDVNIAEPKALIGFAGARVIETTIRQKLPEGFQRAEFLVEHGLVDRIVPRTEMRREFAVLLGHLGTHTAKEVASA